AARLTVSHRTPAFSRSSRAAALVKRAMPHTSLSAASVLAMGTATCPVGPVIRILASRMGRSYCPGGRAVGITAAEVSVSVEQECTPLGLLRLYELLPALGVKRHVQRPRHRSRPRHRPRHHRRVHPARP